MCGGRCLRQAVAVASGLGLLVGAAAWPASIRVTGAVGANAADINGYYAIADGAQLNGKPVWLKQDVRGWSLWLYVQQNSSYWMISNAMCRDVCPETNVTFAAARRDDPTQEPVAAWAVPGVDPSLQQQLLRFEAASWPERIRISGATGARAGAINGDFLRSPGEMLNSRPVWTLQGASDTNGTGWGIWYSARFGMWLLSSAADRAAGGSGSYMYKVLVEADPVREDGPWTVYDGTSWTPQNLVVRDMADVWPPSIRVTGAVSGTMSQINGYYIIDNGTQLNGRPLWRKADNASGAPGWGLWYLRRKALWVVDDATDRGAGGSEQRSIVLKPALCNDPTQEDTNWIVPGGYPSSGVQKSVRVEQASWPENIRISGAVGPIGGYINGDFSRHPTQLINGRPVWVLQDPAHTFNLTVGMWYYLQTSRWIISEVFTSGPVWSWAYVPTTEADPVRERPEQWWIRGESFTWVRQALVVQDLALPLQGPAWPDSIRVTGATGSNAGKINGYYVVDDTTQPNGRPLWLKADASAGAGWGLWWSRRLNAWLVNSASDRAAKGDVGLLYKVASRTLPTQEVAWLVATGSRQELQGVTVEPASWPDRITVSGATGSSAPWVNGNFSRSTLETRNGRPVWVLESATSAGGNVGWGIWYHAASDQWLLASASDRASGSSGSRMYKEVTEADPVRESGAWFVYDGTGWSAQTLLVRDPAMPDIAQRDDGVGVKEGPRMYDIIVISTVVSSTGAVVVVGILILWWKCRKGAKAAPVGGVDVPHYWKNRGKGTFDEWVELDAGINGCIGKLAEATWVPRWTEDRRGDMPEGIQLVKAFRIENSTLWQRYLDARSLVLKQRKGHCPAVEELVVNSAEPGAWLMRTMLRINEVYLWHGTTPSAATSVCKEGLRADAMKAGASFGNGVYLAECSSKSDELAGDDETGPYKGVYCMLLCRAVLGRAHRVMGGAEGIMAEIESAVAANSCDSAIGTREACNGGAYREFVVHKEALVYPEYVVLYLRKHDELRTDHV